MPIRTSGGVFNDQMLTGSLAHYVVCGADFSGAVNSYGKPVPFSAAEIIFKNIESGAYVNIMNPNKCNLSFALEAGRSIWNELSLTEMIRSLGTDVGVDHLNLSNVIVKQVPYIWCCGDDGEDSFLDLSDTPDSYEGYEGYVVAVNPEGDGLIFVPATASNAYSFVEVPSQPLLTAVGSDTLTIIPGANVTIVTDAGANSLTISSTGGGGGGSNEFTAVSAGAALAINQKYYVSTPGTVNLPPLTAANTPGQSVTVTKPVSITVFVNVGDVTDIINTDIGSTDSIEFDATQELVFVVSSENSWELQIGSVN